MTKRQREEREQEKKEGRGHRRRRRWQRNHSGEGGYVFSEKLYKLSAIAERADLSLRTVQQHVAKGALKVVRIGPNRAPRVPESEARRYLGQDPENGEKK